MEEEEGAMLRRPRRIISLEANESTDDSPQSPSAVVDRNIGCKQPSLTKRTPMKELKRKNVSAKQSNDRKSLKRANQTSKGVFAAKTQKQTGRMHGKHGGMGGKKCGRH